MRMKIRARIEELHLRIGGTRAQLSVLERNRVGISGEQMLASLLPLDKGTDATKQFITERMTLLAGQAQQIEAQVAGMQRQISQLEGAADDCLFWLRKYTLPTFSQESLVELDERPHAALEIAKTPAVEALGNVVPFPTQ